MEVQVFSIQQVTSLLENSRSRRQILTPAPLYLRCTASCASKKPMPSWLLVVIALLYVELWALPFPKGSVAGSSV